MKRKLNNRSDHWSKAELQFFKKLKSPDKVQEYLDSLKYRYSGEPQSARTAIKNRTANCFDGAIVGAAALEQLGHIPYIIDLRAVEDDDHILAIFKANGCFGAVAKSNYSGLRYREPVYRNLRELAMSYFENYFNLSGKRSLREYSALYDLRKEKLNWRTGDGSIDEIGLRIDATRHYNVISKASEKILTKLDRRSMLAGKVGRQKK